MAPDAFEGPMPFGNSEEWWVVDEELVSNGLIYKRSFANVANDVALRIREHGSPNITVTAKELDEIAAVCKLEVLKLHPEVGSIVAECAVRADGGKLIVTSIKRRLKRTYPPAGAIGTRIVTERKP
ncbi:MAG: hypothetical protein JSS72_08425 [Armatimonadetes bacterium]|nr:hypothetical protein [Armatimonadota bacterium]